MSILEKLDKLHEQIKANRDRELFLECNAAIEKMLNEVTLRELQNGGKS